MPHSPDSVARRALGQLFPGGRPGLLYLEPLAGQASARKYFRLVLDAPWAPGRGSSLVLALLGDDPLASAEVLSGARPTEPPFLELQALLASAGVPVPAIVLDRWREGYMVLGDLGDLTVKRQIDSGVCTRVEALLPAVQFLVDFQARTWALTDLGLAGRRRFSTELLLWELEHFRQWALLDLAGGTLDPAEDALLTAFFQELAETLAALPPRLVHRDFQSTNLMVHEGRLHLIDFQDALLGPEPYDLVALLRDSYVELTPPELTGLLARYQALRASSGAGPVPADFQRLFHLQTLQRKLKDAGRFVFIDRVRGNPSFLRFIAPSLGFVWQAFEALGQWPEVQDLLVRKVQPGLDALAEGRSRAN